MSARSSALAAGSRRVGDPARRCARCGPGFDRRARRTRNAPTDDLEATLDGLPTTRACSSASTPTSAPTPRSGRPSARCSPICSTAAPDLRRQPDARGPRAGDRRAGRLVRGGDRARRLVDLGFVPGAEAALVASLAARRTVAPTVSCPACPLDRGDAVIVRDRRRQRPRAAELGRAGRAPRRRRAVVAVTPTSCCRRSSRISPAGSSTRCSPRRVTAPRTEPASSSGGVGRRPWPPPMGRRRSRSWSACWRRSRVLGAGARRARAGRRLRPIRAREPE